MNKNNIIQLRQIIAKKITPLIDNDYVLLDVPNHANIGDNLIWEGELQYCREYLSKYKMHYTANVVNCDLSKIRSNDVILLHGGGNWGDLYPECQELRMNIAKKFRKNRIIVFPQTVYYKDKSRVKDECAIFNRHNDIYICLRDKESYDTLRPYISSEKLFLLPDMAFFVEIKSVNKPQAHSKLFLKRTDNESNNISLYEVDNGNFDISDWPTFYNFRFLNICAAYSFVFVNKLARFMQHIPLLSSLVSPVYGLRGRHNREKYIRIGIDFFSRYDEIYTTRLHGLILAILMNKKVFVLDNSYGKCRMFYDTWLSGFDNVIFIGNTSSFTNLSKIE